jgi:glycosyltransferase involved in cell wall biosynthesis
MSVVICTYNRAETLRLALESAVAQDTRGRFEYEVVVVDDESTDNTRQVVEEIAAKAPVPVRYALQQGKGGIAVARNRGLAEAKHPLIVFFDDDQLAEPDWLVELHQVVEKYGVDCIGGARSLAIPQDAIEKLGPTCRIMLGEIFYAPEPEVLSGKALPTTGNLLLSRHLIDTIGTFDERLLASGEDADLLRRARAAGFEIWTAPKAVVAHLIPVHRQKPPYFRWASLRWGNQFAMMDRDKRGKAGLAVMAVARLAQAGLVHFPKYLLAQMRDDAAMALDYQCYLWRAWAYARTALAVIAPKRFAQEQFFRSLDFRNERSLFVEEREPHKTVTAS